MGFNLFGTSSDSKQESMQNTGTASGQGTLAQGNKNNIGTTTVKSSVKNTETNKFSAKGDLSYASNVYGLTADDLQKVKDVFGGSSGSGSPGVTAPGGVSILSTPTPAQEAVAGSNTNIKWSIIAAGAVALGVLYLIFRKKS